MIDQLLSRRQAAEKLGIGLTKLDELLIAGLIPRVKIGRRTLIDPRDLRAYATGQRRTPGAEPPAATGPLSAPPGPPEPAGPAEDGRITPGQQRALHARCGELDELDGEARRTWHNAILRRASERFGRDITSASQLTELEANWVLDELADEIARR